MTLVAFVFIILLQDWWGLVVLLILVLARTPSTIIVRRRFVKGWKGEPEPGVKGNLLIFVESSPLGQTQGSSRCSQGRDGRITASGQDVFGELAFSQCNTTILRQRGYHK